MLDMNIVRCSVSVYIVGIFCTYFTVIKDVNVQYNAAL